MIEDENEELKIQTSTSKPTKAVKEHNERRGALMMVHETRYSHIANKEKQEEPLPIRSSNPPSIQASQLSKPVRSMLSRMSLEKEILM